MNDVRTVKFDPIALSADSSPNHKPESQLVDANFDLFYALCLLVSVATFVAEMTVCCWIAYSFHVEQEILYFFLTVTFITVSSIVSSGFSMRWYILAEDDGPTPLKPSLLRWSCRICTLLLQITQIHRYCNALQYGVRSFVAGWRKQQVKQDYLYRKMLDEDCEASLLRLFYCILNSAPQAVLQLTILLFHKIRELQKCNGLARYDSMNKCQNTLFVHQCVSVGLSIFSIAWSLMVYDRTVRYVREDKNSLSFIGNVLNFLSHLTWTISRIFALAVLASLYPRLALLGFVIHSGLMSVWLIYTQDPNFNQCDECVLDCMLGIAYIFVYISSHNGPQRYSYLWYYFVCFTENIGCLFVWYQYMNPHNDELYAVLIVVQILSFFMSLFFLLLYYKCFHPNHKYFKNEVHEMKEIKKRTSL